MKAVVAHHLWGRVGGGELVNAYVAKTLMERGHKVAIVSTFNFDRKKYREWFNLDLGETEVYFFLPGTLPLFGIYQRLGIFIPLKRAIRKERPNIVFIDNELYRPILRMKERINFKILEYIHFPFHALKILKGETPREYIETFKQYTADARIYHEKYEKGLWKLYFKTWLKIHNKIARENPFEAADVVMANSHYIAKLIKILWNGEAKVLHPPVKVNDFKSRTNKGFDERNNAIVMIGRISPEKRIEDVIDAIAITETKPVLRVIGGMIPSALYYKSRLMRRSLEKGVRIEFYINVSRQDLINIATSSKLFVHATKGEHFGIAVVEGMAAGCPVIVHKSGGPYEDITNYGEYGLLYENLSELAENIDKLMTSAKLWRIYHEKALSRSLLFNEDSFKEGLVKIMGI